MAQELESLRENVTYPCTHITLFGVFTTSKAIGRRRMNVKITLCAHWDWLDAWESNDPQPTIHKLIKNGAKVTLTWY